MNDECTFMDDCKCLSCTRQNRIKQLERELHESRQREATLRRVIQDWLDYDGFNADAAFDVFFREALSTTTPAETMVCLWHDNGGVFNTGCNHILSIDIDNYGFKCCGFCAKPISYAPQEKGQS